MFKARPTRLCIERFITTVFCHVGQVFLESTQIFFGFRFRYRGFDKLDLEVGEDQSRSVSGPILDSIPNGPIPGKVKLILVSLHYQLKWNNCDLRKNCYANASSGLV